VVIGALLTAVDALARAETAQKYDSLGAADAMKTLNSK